MFEVWTVRCLPDLTFRALRIFFASTNNRVKMLPSNHDIRIAHMSRWLAKLKGNTSDLEEFPYWFPLGESHSFAESGSFYVVSSKFVPSQEAHHVYALAQILIDEWSSVISLLWQSLIPPTIDQLIFEDDEGRRQVHHMLAGASLSSRSKARAKLADSNDPTQAQLLNQKASTNAILRDALALWILPNRTWPRLYRILEDIESALGGDVSRLGLCAKRERSKFTGSANSAEIAGANSRHGSEKYALPKETMVLNEANSFIASLLKKALLRI
jgi:hypothetical protein